MLQNLGATFIWWIGVVENRKDPLKVGRCQVRIAGSHTEQKSILPTADLPWAHPMIPLNDTASLQLKEGDYVVGFYLDGKESQKPIIMGLLPGMPVERRNPTMGFTDPRLAEELATAPKLPESLEIDSQGNAVTINESDPSRYPSRLNESTLSRLARNEHIEQTVIESKNSSTFKSIPKAAGGTYSEPDSPYAAVYPYNRVMETESGHIVEYDDTPGAERIHIYHRSGTFDEYHPNGDRVGRVNGDSYEIVLSDKHIYVNGDVNFTAKGDINLKAGKNLNIEAGGDVRIKATTSMITQAGVAHIQYSSGPMSLTGIPLNLNTPGAVIPLGPTGVPITVSVSSTTVLTPPVIPDPTVPGNVALTERPGANLTDTPVNELTPEVPTPTDIPAPANTNTTPVSTITTTEGADAMIRAMNRAGLTDPIQRAAIYAQAAHESNNFKQLIESFKFTREGLLKTWHKYFDDSNIDQYLRKDAKIASRVYGNRMGNGTEESQDGWTYRGRGFIQLTSKVNYLAAARAFNQDFVNYPDLVAEPDLSADIAVWYFLSGPKGGYRGSYNDIIKVTKFVNGGLNGLDDRTAKFTTAKANTLVTTYNTALV
jgi:putative chitinase